MVTHRWWGNKFCKRACKNAHRRENHHTQSGWVIPRFFTFAGGACLAAAVAVAMLTLLLASANAAPGEERPVAGSSLEFNKEDGTLYIDWSGPIVAGMADDLRAAHPRQARGNEHYRSRQMRNIGAPHITCTPLECSTFISLGTRSTYILQNAAGWFLTHFSSAFGPNLAQAFAMS